MERYESLGPVGEGSYGTVQKCRHRDSGRLVAIKKFVDSDNDKTVKKIALREIKLLRKLRHDNLVNLLEAWKRRRRWYLVFEFVERTLLDDLEQNPSGLDLNTSRQYLYQILRAAAFCHQQNVIHRDIKPENILISQGGVVKLCDFGFARIVASPAEGGVYTDYVATRWYRAPELLVGDTEYSKPVDVWAVGCLSVETLTGRPLFPGDSDLDQIHHIVGCFGKLTAHQRELFYRNPVFSGVRLPECSGRVRLEQRFPTIAPTALDLARSCLQMDPERRAQCSELLEHPLFTQDSFHIRVLDELNAKIQKDHRENSTLPKIGKTPRREKDERDEKNRRGKDEKRPKAAGEEKARKGEEKTAKTTGKQPSKPSKSIRNTSDPVTSTKQPKTSGTKIIDKAAKTTAATISKLGKATGAELRKEPKISRPIKTVTDPKEDYAAAAKPKYGNAVSPALRRDSLKTTKDTRARDASGLRSSRSDNIASRATESKKVAKSPKSSTTYSTDTHSTLKTRKISTAGYPEGAPTVVTSKTSDGDRAEESSTLKASQPSRDDRIEVATPTIPSVAKPRKKTTTSDHRTDRSTADAEQRRTSKSLTHLKLWPKNAQKRHAFVHRPFKGS